MGAGLRKIYEFYLGKTGLGVVLNQRDRRSQNGRTGSLLSWPPTRWERIRKKGQARRVDWRKLKDRKATAKKERPERGKKKKRIGEKWVRGRNAQVIAYKGTRPRHGRVHLRNEGFRRRNGKSLGGTKVGRQPKEKTKKTKLRRKKEEGCPG